MDESAWAAVEKLVTWLDSNDQGEAVDRTVLLRIMKISEEAGEVAAAVIGVTGQNPRKGVTHTWDDVRSELCDVIITAMVALRTLGADAPEVLRAKLDEVVARSVGGIGGL